MANRNAAVTGERTEGLIDARNGAPKNTQTTFEAKQSHVAVPGVLAHNVSSTEAQRILGNDGGLGEVMGGGTPGTYPALSKAGHRGENVPIHSGMTDEQRMNAKTDGPDVLREAILSGSTKLPAQVSEETDNGEPVRQPDCPTK